MASQRAEEIQRLERDISLERLVQARGIQLRSQGGLLVGACPLHEATGQIAIEPVKNTWSCSTCSVTQGSAVTWVMKADGVSKKHAIELLKADFSGSASMVKKGRQKGVVPKHTSTRKLDVPFGGDEPDDVLLARVVAFYNQMLKNSPEAMTFLRKRGITNSEVITHFQLGFANRTLAYRLPEKSRKAGAELRGRLQRLGVLRESGHEHMNGSVVVPLFDATGKVTNIYGRKVTPNLRAGTELHTWLGASRKGVFNVGVFASSKTVIITGSILDALALWSSGQRNVTAVHGFDGSTDDLLDAFNTHGTKKVLLAFRRDVEGDKAAEKIGKTIAEHGVEVFRMLFPAGMDAIDYIKSVPNPSEALDQVVRSAQWMAGKSASKSSMTTAAMSITQPDPVVAGSVMDIAPAVTTPGRDGSPLQQSDIQNSRSGPAATPPATNGIGSSGGHLASATKTPTDEVVLTFDDRRWRIRGLSRNTGPETMKVNVMVSKNGAAFHVDVVELYSARQRTTFVKMASDELGLDEKIVKKDLGYVLLKLEEAQDELLRRQAKPETMKVEMTDEDRDAALGLLRDPRLLDRILDAFEHIGVVGERDNLLVGYLASISRKLDHPLAVVIQSSSAAGKSSLMEAVLNFIPEEDRLSFSAMTGQSLYYMGSSSLKHKLLSIAEEAGAERASYALKLLQSEGALTIASTGKDPGTGRLVSQEYRVEGPVAIMMTTTAIDVDEELLSRCIVLSVDEGPEQTRKIQERQRVETTLEGRIRRHERTRLVKLHQNAQRLLKPLLVVNPFTSEMTYGDHRVRARRDHRKLLGLIEALALLHQHQRPVKTIEHGGHVVEYIEVEKRDIEIAIKLMHEIGGSWVDDLPPQTRKLLGLLVEHVKMAVEKGASRKDFRFSRREVREALGLGDTQLWTHLRRLAQAEYLLVHPSGHGRGVVYELVFDSTTQIRGNGGSNSGHIRPVFGGNSGGGRCPSIDTITRGNGSDRVEAPAEAENARPGSAGEAHRTVDEPAGSR